ncbi:PAS domain S-box protein [Rhodohalobacter sp. SW132]|uniref:histidine kinase dimerization/phosphoacceptor domain -containing protein n=1 Tax=Rhodohalobacter sp. SW132 TaxID=2293433 RepID=UPI000E24EDC6|nr:histidine kinase dimerization/phosphoacceptor domain -containing protein [Rhodohalobacter sp. SW132]REL33088.1 PAS domain S-box protein [Rhodohalobacter sp. SW132]
MIIEKEIKAAQPSSETGLNELRDRMMSILKTGSDICEATTSLIFIHEDSVIRILASDGDGEEHVVSAAQKISGVLDPENGLSVIENVREHHKFASLLSDEELEKVKFYTGTLFRNEAGNNIGAFCICDSNPRELSEIQKQQLGVIADGVNANLMLYNQTELSNENSRKLKISSALLKNSADITFLLEPETGEIAHVSIGVRKVLGYSPDMLQGIPFSEIVETDELEGDKIEELFSIEKQHRGRYTTSIRLKDRENQKRWFQCNFSADENHWYVTATDISDKKEAEQGVYDLRDKLKKVVSVATDLIYNLNWESGELSWGDELTNVLGYPNTEKFVNYDWWLDKIHPDDLKRVIHDVELTVEGESRKMKLVYRIRTFDGSYKYVMNRVYVDRNEDGTPEDIIGAIVDISELTEIEEQSKSNKKLLEQNKILLAEIHHRVKNNLAVVSGMLILQALNETDEQVQKKLYASTGRIKTMATIHELLYKSSNFVELKIDENIEQIITSLVGTFDVSVDLDISYNMKPVELNIDDALPCSLIVNEVITNILKYAYNDGDSGLVEVFLIEEDETVTLKIRDDGKGLPKDFNDEGNGNTLGMVLIQTLTKQLNGEYSYTSLDRGVEFKLVFNKSAVKDIDSNSMK